MTSSDIAGRLVSVRGTVVKASTIRPLVVQMNFECGKCRTQTTRIFPDGKFSPPTGCAMYGCKSRTFLPIRSAAKLIDFQKIRQGFTTITLKVSALQLPSNVQSSSSISSGYRRY